MVRAFWFTSHNFGDNLNHYLLSRISKNGVVFTEITDPDKKVVPIGSILGWCNESTIAWGPGLGNYGDHVNPAADIRAVRGPLSLRRARECGCRAPDVFGDPALLLPLVYRPAQRKTHALGIIPHYIDQKHVFERYGSESREIVLVDILDTPERVADTIAGCDRVVSSSLHGIIVAHAYGVPAAWASFSEGKIGGDGFKYHDHFASVGCHIEDVVNCSQLPSISEIIESSKHYFFLEPRIDVAPLIAAAPFELAALG